MKCKKCEGCFHKKVCSDYSDYKTDTLAYMGVRFEPEKCKDYVDVSDKDDLQKLNDIVYKHNLTMDYIVKFMKDIAPVCDYLSPTCAYQEIHNAIEKIIEHKHIEY